MQNIDELHYLEIFKKLDLDDFPSSLNVLMYSECSYVFYTDYYKSLHLATRLITKKMFNISYNKTEGASLVSLNYYRNRLDRDCYWDYIQSLFPNRSEILMEQLVINKAKFWPLMVIAKNFIRFIRYYIELKEVHCTSHRLYFSSRMLDFFNICQTIKALNISERIALCYYDGGYFENCAVPICRDKGCVTLTCQHGQPIFRSMQEDLVNQSQILNFKSDYYLASNRFTLCQFIKAGHDISRIKVIGSFKKINIRAYRNTGYFIVFLDCITLPFARNSNNALLSFAQEFASQSGLKYYVKLHPSDNEDNYEVGSLISCVGLINRKHQIADYIDIMTFGLFHASSIYLDLLSNYIKPFRQIISDINYQIIDRAEDECHSVNELIDKFTKWNKQSDSERLQYYSDRIHESMNREGAEARVVAFIDELVKRGSIISDGTNTSA